jgi:hypothetical protein
MSYKRSAYEARMLREQSSEGRAFRAGARCEALTREAATVLHHELIDYVRALAEHHPDWPSSRVAETAARVFAVVDEGQTP